MHATQPSPNCAMSLKTRITCKQAGCIFLSKRSVIAHCALHHRYIIMELCHGGELLDYLMTHGSLKEDDAAYCMHQIMQGVRHLHEVKIVHRDLKVRDLP